MDYTPADVRRFFTYVERLPNGCWFWTGARSRGSGNVKWYGSFRVGRKVVRAHRFACDVIGEKGSLPAGHHRDHVCEFSLCVNPDHLEHVTHEENERRKQARFRARQEYVISSAWAGGRSLAEIMGTDA